MTKCDTCHKGLVDINQISKGISFPGDTAWDDFCKWGAFPVLDLIPTHHEAFQKTDWNCGLSQGKRIRLTLHSSKVTRFISPTGLQRNSPVTFQALQKPRVSGAFTELQGSWEVELRFLNRDGGCLSRFSSHLHYQGRGR